MTRQLSDLLSSLGKLDEGELRGRIQALREERRPAKDALNQSVSKERKKKASQSRRIGDLMASLSPTERAEVLKLLGE